MKGDKNGPGVLEDGATVVITHRVQHDKLDAYEEWMKEISPVSRSYPGCLDWHVVRPVPGLSSTFTVIIRYDTEEHLRNWMYSEDRNRLIEKVRPLLATDDDFFIRSGLDFWFTPEGAKARVPVRWKQALVTWSAIYPLVLFMPILLAPVTRTMGIGENRYLSTLFVTGVLVILMVYLIMPHYTRLIHRWLFK